MRKKSPRVICLDILNQVEAGRHVDRLLSDSFKRHRDLIPLDRAFLTELSYGVIRWRGRLDWIIRQFSKVPFDKIESEILNVLRLGLYQILFLTRTPASAAVNESAEMAKKFRGKGGAAFVNAILRSVLRQREEIPYPQIDEDPIRYLSVVQSHPLWLVRRWVTEMGVGEAQKACAFNNQVSPLALRVNTLKMDRRTLIEKMREKGLEAFPAEFSEDGIVVRNAPPTSELPLLKEGFYMIQDEASQLVTFILDPKPKERILDACAAPGGKTTHIAQKMEDEGEICALDLSRDKLNLIEEICRKLGIKIVRTVKGDSSGPLPSAEGLTFDRILADVPCSGFGTLRKNPDVKWRRGENEIRRLSELQSKILENLSGYVKEGGILVYSTCTVFHEENEDVVEKFLDRHREFRLDRIDQVLPEKSHPFIKNGHFKTFPPDGGMDGFFVARLLKE